MAAVCQRECSLPPCPVSSLPSAMRLMAELLSIPGHRCIESAFLPALRQTKKRVLGLSTVSMRRQTTWWCSRRVEVMILTINQMLLNRCMYLFVLARDMGEFGQHLCRYFLLLFVLVSAEFQYNL